MDTTFSIFYAFNARFPFQILASFHLMSFHHSFLFLFNGNWEKTVENVWQETDHLHQMIDGYYERLMTPCSLGTFIFSLIYM